VTESPVLDRNAGGRPASRANYRRSHGELLQRASSTLGTTVGTDTVTELPVANPNFTQIIGLSAGTSVGVNDATPFGKGTLDIAVNGANPGQNNFQMDGVAIQSMAGNGSANDRRHCRPQPRRNSGIQDPDVHIRYQRTAAIPGRMSTWSPSRGPTIGTAPALSFSAMPN
jgi:hypothetical protein